MICLSERFGDFAKWEEGRYEGCFSPEGLWTRRSLEVDIIAWCSWEEVGGLGFERRLVYSVRIVYGAFSG